MSVTFTPARFAEVEQEIVALWVDHWTEIGEDRERVPLNPNLGRYRLLDDAGLLEITAARRGSELVGYLFSVVDCRHHGV